MARYIDSEPLEKFYQDTLDDISGMKEYEECAEYCKKALENLKEQPTVKAIPKDQYEARLKADMIAMLEDLDL